MRWRWARATHLFGLTLAGWSAWMIASMWFEMGASVVVYRPPRGRGHAWSMRTGHGHVATLSRRARIASMRGFGWASRPDRHQPSGVKTRG